MSSSTVSLTANRSGASLIRPTLTADKKPSFDFAGNDETDALPATGADTSRAKDLSHSIKEASETVLERSKDAVLTKNTNSTTKLRKRTVVKKGSVPSSSRPPWKTAFGEYDGRIESMEKSLMATEWLSKDEFDKFVEEFKVKKGVDDIGELKLDEIRAFAREIVEKEIGKHAADGLGRVDYAVASGGAMVLKHSEAFTGSSRVLSWFSGNVRNDAVKVLQPSFGQPGECFPLKGDSGFVEIKLRAAIVPEAITLEHVSKRVTRIATLAKFFYNF
ncbi:hypothetical protein E3N88_28351 [Mikania micrantha]|uniref:SUN domain-containing protein n=1 Tax=Mikania micrantha TaxID=192012 RepID=A0A5N6N0E2_9ASTR|nr:hypothetical protein E3N88_28351 [Mikania micrantha]